MNKKILSIVIGGLLTVSSLPAIGVSAAQINNSQTMSVMNASRHYSHHPVPANYVGYVYCTGDGVAVRNQNSTVLTRLNCGDRIYIYGLVDGQGVYIYNGQKVYVAGQYLSTVYEPR